MAKLPELITPDAEVLKRINAGLGQVLKRMHERELVPTSVTGGSVVTNPSHLYAFLNTFKANRDVGEGILVDQEGNPVDDDATLLDCGFSSAQLERFLVIACARKAYAEFGGETKGKLPDELKAYLVFGWQLPLLEIFVQQMTRYQFAELGHGILYLKSPARLKALAGASATDIRKVREIVGERYDEMMQQNPIAIRGISHCDEKSFEFFVKISGERLWSFFGGNQQLVVELLGEEKKRLLSLGPHFPDLCVETYRALEDVPTPMLAPFLRAFAKVFGPPGRALLGDPQFAAGILVGMVNDFRELKAATNDELVAVEEAAALKFNLVKPKIIAWIKANKQKKEGE